MAITLRELDGLSYEDSRYHGLSGWDGAFAYLPGAKLLIIKFNRLSGVDDSGILEKGIRHAEKLSALMDGETLDNELLNELSRSSEMQKPGELSPYPRYAAWRYR